MKRSFIDTYNRPGNLLVITNYPPKGGGVHAAKIGGVAGFAKNTLVPLAKRYDREDRKIIVLADTLGTLKTYEEDGMLVLRSWKRGTLRLYLDIFNNIRRFNAVRDILIEFEFASFGDFWVTALFPLLLGLLRLLGKRTTLVLHQVVTDLWSLNGHLGLKYDSREYQLFSRLLPFFYAAVTHLAHQTLVLEEMLKNRLRDLAPMERISVIHHGTEDRENRLTKQTARRRLKIPSGKYVVLSFGFITWYKGTDALLASLKNTTSINGRPLQLIIAGGTSPTLWGKPHYDAYYQSVVNQIKTMPHARLTGFVPDEKLDLYFRAADVVVFPYRTMMSSSGPLSIALSYGKPVLLSDAMRPYLWSPDVRNAMEEARIKPRDLVIPQDLSKLPNFLAWTSRRRTREKLVRFTQALAARRAFTNTAYAYAALVSPKPASGILGRVAFDSVPKPW